KSHEMTFDICTNAGGPSGPLQNTKGTQKLDATEQGTIDAAMKALVVSKSTACGADKGPYTVTVTTPRGTKTYYASFSICNGGGKTYVDNIDGVFSAFGKFTPVF